MIINNEEKYKIPYYKYIIGTYMKTNSIFKQNRLTK